MFVDAAALLLAQPLLPRRAAVLIEARPHQLRETVHLRQGRVCGVLDPDGQRGVQTVVVDPGQHAELAKERRCAVDAEWRTGERPHVRDPGLDRRLELGERCLQQLTGQRPAAADRLTDRHDRGRVTAGDPPPLRQHRRRVRMSVLAREVFRRSRPSRTMRDRTHEMRRGHLDDVADEPELVQRADDTGVVHPFELFSATIAWTDRVERTGPGLHEGRNGSSQCRDGIGGDRSWCGWCGCGHGFIEPWTTDIGVGGKGI